MQWNTDLLGKYVAPGIADFTAAAVVDLTDEFPEAQFWLRNYFLNNALGDSFPEKTRKVVLAFLRRAHGAFFAYHQARDAMMRYLSGNQPDNPRIQGYYDAVDKWETFTLQSGMAMDLFKWLNGGSGAFSKHDGSAECRIYTIANQIKHVASCIETGQCGPNENVPLWLDNDGLRSFGNAVTYVECAEQLRALARLADQLQDPRGFSGERRLKSQALPSNEA